MKNIYTFLLVVLVVLTGLATLHGQTLHDVITVGNSFSPANLTIQAGDTVRWTNTGAGFHNVNASDNSFRCANGCDGSGGNGNPASNVWSFKLIFNSSGTIAYYCQIHGTSGGAGMAGTVTVQAAVPPACTNLTAPANGATGVPVTTALTWAPATGNPTGYRLDVGTMPGGTDILNNFEPGNVTTYNPPGDFPYNAAIYVKIIPYNANGNAAGCAEESFSTEVCTPNLVVTGIPVPAGTYHSAGNLTSHTSTIANGSTVVFISDTGVLLDDDFIVELGAIFEAIFQVCP